MGKEDKNILDKTIAKILAEQAERECDEKEKTRMVAEAEAAKSAQINKDYESIVVPFEKKYLNDHSPKELVDLLEDFKTQFEGKTKVKFSVLTSFIWGAEDYTGSDKNFLSVLYAYREKDRHIDDKEESVRALSEGKTSPSFARIYQTESKHENVYRPGLKFTYDLYFGFIYIPEAPVKWFISNLEEGLYSGNSDEISSLAHFLALIVISKDPIEALKEYHPPFDNRDSGPH